MSAAIPGGCTGKDKILLRKSLFIAVVVAIAVVPTVLAQRYISGIVWPEPAVITPGENNIAPSDAIVLFDGKNFDAWKGADKWKSDEDGGFTVKGAIQTKQEFGDCQLHVEWASTKVVKGKEQGRGNNGIGLMGARYEIQVLDSYQNPTYFEGQAGSVYNQRPPMVNASRKPGEWQTYDIVFTAPRFTSARALEKPAVVTVLHNGVLVHNATPFWGPTAHRKIDPYTPENAKGPIALQDHGNPIHYRNIWIRAITEKP
jgi:hypothetical protein